MDAFFMDFMVIPGTVMQFLGGKQEDGFACHQQICTRDVPPQPAGHETESDQAYMETMLTDAKEWCISLLDSLAEESSFSGSCRNVLDQSECEVSLTVATL